MIPAWECFGKNPFGYSKMQEETGINGAIQGDKMKIGSYSFDSREKSYIMGILNVTPDSFSDGGRFCIGDIDAVLRIVEDMVASGMDVLDVGGESTRPGYTRISPDEEIERVVPVIEAVKKNFDIPVSLDTYKSEVAGAGIRAGADMINDIWGLKYDKDMAPLIADSGVSCVLMHNRENAEYTDFIEDVAEDLKVSIKTALDAGIERDRILIDPGVGFAKDFRQNLLVMEHLDRLCSLGFPVLLAASRKSVIGNALDLPTGERLEGTLATSVLGRMKGASFFRVHDVKENRRALDMTDAVLNAV